MILQTNILLKIIKKNYKWFIIFLAMIVLNLIFLMVRPEQVKITEMDFFPIIGYPTLNNSFISILLYVYQFVFLIYIVYIFLKDDFDYSFENIILRIDSKTWIAYKTIILFLFILIFKIFQYFVAYIYFYDKINCHCEYLFYSILLSLLIVTFIIFNFNFSKKCNIILSTIEVLIFIVIFIHFNFAIPILIIIAITFFNINYFNFKRAFIKL